MEFIELKRMYQMIFIDAIHDIKTSRFRKALHVMGGFLKRLYAVCVCSLQLAALHIDEEVTDIRYETVTVELLAHLNRYVMCFQMLQEDFTDVCR